MPPLARSNSSCAHAWRHYYEYPCVLLQGKQGQFVVQASCAVVTPGCMDTRADNYNPRANRPAHSGPNSCSFDNVKRRGKPV